MNYAPIDEAWSQMDPDNEYPSTYAVYGGLRPELNRPVDIEGVVNGPIGFDRGGLCPNSSLNESDTFSQLATPIIRNNHETRKSRRASIPIPEVDNALESGYESPIPRKRRTRNMSISNLLNHFNTNRLPEDHRECLWCQQMYSHQPTGVFWWLDSRDAFIIIGGLVLLTLVGILIKRS